CDGTVVPVVACFRLAQPYTSQLGINENCIGNQAIMDGSIAVFKEVGANNAEIVVGDMGESRATFYITQRINTRDIGFQLLIGWNKAFFIYLHPGSSRVEPIGVGSA